MAMFDSLVEVQTDLRSLISRTMTNLKKIGVEKKTRYAIEARIKSLDNNWQKFQTNHETLSLSRNEKTRTHSYFTENAYPKCEEEYFDQAAMLSQELHKLTGRTGISGDNGQSSAVTQSLPKIPLPKFSGKYQEWPPFRDLFRALVHRNKDLTDVERLQYLKTHVTGEAAKHISNIAVTADNFERAWKKLETRYQHKRLIVNAHLDTIFKQKPLTRKSANNLKMIFSNITEALGPIQHWDLILVPRVT